MSTYKCWCPARGETSDTGKLLVHTNAWCASELYAEDYCDFENNRFEQIVIATASSDSNYEKVVMYEVTVSLVPRFVPRCVDVSE